MKPFDYMVMAKKGEFSPGEVFDLVKYGILREPKKREITPWGEEVIRLIRLYSLETGQKLKPITGLMSIQPRRRNPDGRSYYDMSFPELVDYESFWPAAKKAFEYNRTEIYRDSPLVRSYFKATGERFQIETQSGIIVVTDLSGNVEQIAGLSVDEWFEANPGAEARMIERPKTIKYRDWESCLGEEVKTAYRIK